jgi:hypothetical protein
MGIGLRSAGAIHSVRIWLSHSVQHIVVIVKANFNRSQHWPMVNGEWSIVNG